MLELCGRKVWGECGRQCGGSVEQCGGVWSSVGECGAVWGRTVWGECGRQCGGSVEQCGGVWSSVGGVWSSVGGVWSSVGGVWEDSVGGVWSSVGGQCEAVLELSRGCWSHAHDLHTMHLRDSSR